MKLLQALVVVCPVLVCGDIKADSDGTSFKVNTGVKTGLRSSRSVPLKKNVQDRGREGKVLPMEHHSAIPVPPVPGSNATLPHKVWLHYQDQRQQQDLLLSSLRPKNKKSPQQWHSPSGKFPNLILLVRFADHTSRALPSQAGISRLYNSEEFKLDDRQRLEKGDDKITPTGSVRQVFFENSHSTLTVDTTVIDWITLSHTEEYYAAGEYGLPKSKFKEAMVEALTILDTDPKYSDFDFSSFDLDANGALDGFGVLHSGYGAEFGGADCKGTMDTNRIWSHKGRFNWASSKGGVKAKRYYVSSSLRGKCESNIVRMGVLCHELGHYLGLPDLYDTSFEGKGLGAYDFMSQSWGWDGTGLYPSNLSAWSKLQLGWATADLIDTDGTYELEAATSTGIKVYKITRNFPEDEYLLLENRQPIAYDSKMSEGGIAIYHIDESIREQRNSGFPSQSGWPENGNHYKVALLSANGEYDLEQGINDGDVGDLWHAGSKLTELGPGPDSFPNTDYYEKGVVGRTGIRIYGFSVIGNIMKFSVAGLTESPSAPTLSPTVEDLVPYHVPTGQSVVSFERN